MTGISMYQFVKILKAPFQKTPNIPQHKNINRKTLKNNTRKHPKNLIYQLVQYNEFFKITDHSQNLYLHIFEIYSQDVCTIIIL